MIALEHDPTTQQFFYNDREVFVWHGALVYSDTNDFVFPNLSTDG